MRTYILSLLLICSTGLAAQFPQTFTSTDIYHQLQEAANGKRILYLAAHPDDENTRLISYFENGMHVRTAYLSLTRGSGGQNLIGTEIGPGIGVLRTQELLAARRVDGGEQYFTRAVDFGYSKSADESFDKWGRENVLSDVVYVIRKFRPDVIITRFPPTRRAGHGHHEASAILAAEAFDMAGDPNAFPEQLKYVKTWQPGRLYFNASTWWNKGLPEIAAGDSADYVTMDIGAYNSLLGESYGQIAAVSRSQHRSQGFGSDFPYGSSIEYLQYVKGSKVAPGGNILSGLESDWERFDAQDIEAVLQEALSDFDFRNPGASLPRLITAAKELSKLDNNPFFRDKKEQINALILDVLHVAVEFTTDAPYTVPGGQVNADLMINNPGDRQVKLVQARCFGNDLGGEIELIHNEVYEKKVNISIPSDAPFSNPYWLREPFTYIYKVEDYHLLGNADNEPAIAARLVFDIDGYTFGKSYQLKEKHVDPAQGVMYTPVYVVPRVSFNFSEDVVISPVGESAKTVKLTVENHNGKFDGTVGLSVPEGWTVQPVEHKISFERTGEKVILVFTVQAGKKAKNGLAEVVATSASGDLRSPAMSLQRIDYPHIPAQIILKPAAVKLVPLDLNRGNVRLIGYIDGPGDDVARYLEAAGYTVEHIDAAMLSNGDLSRYDAILTGIRAFNTRPELVFANDNLNRYVKNGGTWIVQYNTTRGLLTDQIGPYPFTISHERVTEEDAPPTLLEKNSPVFNQPNKISASDFDGWVQERGLYFASDWDGAFTPLIAWHDQDEPDRLGGFLVAPYGKGYFVYTGISFFRELPAGVPGAYRLLANLLDLGNGTPKN